MKCAEVKNLLSRYLEGDLDNNAKGALDEHLKTCAGCTRELNELKALVSSLKNIPEVEPPPYFLEGVHARLERPSGLNEFLRRLSVPVYIKVPLEAAALTAAVILVFFLIQKTEFGALLQQREFKNLAKIETAKVGTAGLSKERGTQDVAYKAVEPISEKITGTIGLDSSMRGYDYSSTQSGAQSFQAPFTGNYYKTGGYGEGGVLVQGVPKAAVSPTLTEEPEKHIIVKAKDLNQDVAELQSMLSELGIEEIKYENYPDRATFSFSIPALKLEELLAGLRAWREVAYPLESQPVTQEDESQVLSITIILASQ